MLQQRDHLGKPPQPVQIVCSAKAEIDLQLRFFGQPLPRWLLTTSVSARRWHGQPGFERVLAVEMTQEGIDWPVAFQQLAALGLERLAVLGGGKLVASLLAADLIDELSLTICPLILGGATATTPVEGAGFLPHLATAFGIVIRRGHYWRSVCAL